MTQPSDALHELAQQHQVLRAMMDECESIADNVDAAKRDVGALVEAVVALRLAFAEHNQYEEQVLRPILRELDAFGDVRVEHMFADHVDEHRALRHRLDGPTAELRMTLYELRAHLATEERYFLSPRVLRDDVVNLESSG